MFDVTADSARPSTRRPGKQGGLQFRACFRDLLVDKAANDTAANFICDKIRQIVKDPATAEKLADIDHPYAAKRPPIDSNYFETFNRDNVSLVDVREAPIEAITPAGIRTRDGEVPTRHHCVRDWLRCHDRSAARLNIRGRNGLSLAEAWQAGPRNYLGLQVAGFPNLFTVTGPGSPSVLCNMPVAIEQHVEWISGLHRAYALEWLSANRGVARGDGALGGRGQRRRQCHAAAAGAAFLVSGCQRTGQAARVHALRGRHGATTARFVTMSPARAMRVLG